MNNQNNRDSQIAELKAQLDLAMRALQAIGDNADPYSDAAITAYMTLDNLTHFSEGVA